MHRMFIEKIEKVLLFQMNVHEDYNTNWMTWLQEPVSWKGSSKI